eukprot:83888-Prorocentrum_minimum.AAC.1
MSQRGGQEGVRRGSGGGQSKGVTAMEESSDRSAHARRFPGGQRRVGSGAYGFVRARWTST